MKKILKQITELRRKSIKEIYKQYKESINYLFFGLLSTIVNFVCYYLFARIIGIDKVVSSGMSWFCAVLFAYITNKIWVFESKTNSRKETLKEMISFFLCRIFSGILCDVGTFALMVKVFHINDIFSKIVTQVMVIIVNYVLSKMIVFKKK